MEPIAFASTACRLLALYFFVQALISLSYACGYLVPPFLGMFSNNASAGRMNWSFVMMYGVPALIEFAAAVCLYAGAVPLARQLAPGERHSVPAIPPQR